MSEPIGEPGQEERGWDAVEFYARARHLGLCQDDS
jgi:hypothetical protein